MPDENPIQPVPEPPPVVPAPAPAQTFKPETLAAMQVFARSFPWRGTVPERKLKFSALHAALSAAYGLTVELRMDGIPDTEAPGVRSYGTFCAATAGQEAVAETPDEPGRPAVSPTPAFIRLDGKLSVVTYLRAFANARFAGTEDSWGQSQRWAQGLYRRVFPENAARMVNHNGYVTRPQDLPPPPVAPPVVPGETPWTEESQTD